MLVFARPRLPLTVWFGIAVLGGTASTGLASNDQERIPNPVLPGVADAGVVRFGGRYYIMGSGTAGAMYVSDDLVSWRGPTHVFSMNNDWTSGASARDRQIHACDISLRNGRFYLYWSVNYRELRNIGLAIADQPLGPYLEPEAVRRRPFDGRIDPHLFVDDDGRHYFYTVKFNDGNVIWGQPMTDPMTLTGQARPLLSAIRGTWEWRDHKVNEGPCVIRYRGRCYMIYNANHTSERYGHYALGVAEAESPLALGNASKYSAPVVESNRQRILARSRVVVPISTMAAQAWRYTEHRPSKEWTAADFNDDQWDEGQAGFGSPDVFMRRSTVRTPWRSDHIWLRKRFALARAPSEHLQVVVIHNGTAEIYLNGARAYAAKASLTGYATADVPREARTALRIGQNVIAVHCARDKRRAQYVDAGLIDPGEHAGEPIIHNPGQPNLVRGPNGFEWWLVYFALYNGSPRRGQAIDRVHFLGRELFVDGPTSARTPGYHPPPAVPTFCDRFASEASLSNPWRCSSGLWRIEDDEVHQLDESGLHTIRLTGPYGTCYLFETSIRFLAGRGGQAGVVGWHAADASHVRIGLDRRHGTWFTERIECGAGEPTPFELPKGFNWQGWHTIRIEKNANVIAVRLDGIPAPVRSVAGVPCSRPGTPGLFARDAQVAFGHAIYTLGWDEFGSEIRGWGPARCGATASGQWRTGKSGLTAERASSARIFKGDLLDGYEFSVQITPSPDTSGTPAGAARRVGVYAVWVNAATHLAVTADLEFRTITATGQRDAAAIQPRTARTTADPHRRQRAGQAGHNLRIVKLADRVLVFVDGQECLTCPGKWPASQVGLVADDVPCRFNGITLFDRPRSSRRPQ